MRPTQIAFTLASLTILAALAPLAWAHVPDQAEDLLTLPPETLPEDHDVLEGPPCEDEPAADRCAQLHEMTHDLFRLGLPDGSGHHDPVNHADLLMHVVADHWMPVVCPAAGADAACARAAGALPRGLVPALAASDDKVGTLCSFHSEACAGLNATRDEAVAGDLFGAFVAILDELAPAACVETGACDPEERAYRPVCDAGLEGTCEGAEETGGHLPDLADNRDPSYAEHSVRDHLVPGVCDDAAPKCEDAQARADELRRLAEEPPTLTEEAGVLTLTEPVAGETYTGTVPVAFATKLPASDERDLGGFLLQSAPQGTGDWTDVGWIRCDGAEARECATSWDDGPEGRFSLRVVYLNGTAACVLGQCSYVRGTFLVDHGSLAVALDDAYALSGASYAVDACVTKGGEPADAGNATVTVHHRGAEAPMSHVAGCVWRRSFTAPQAAGIEESPFVVNATLGNADATASAVAVFSPDRIVALDAPASALAGVGDEVVVEVVATFPDDGSPASFAHVHATLGDDTVATAYAGGDGVATFRFSSDAIAARAYNLSADEAGDAHGAVVSRVVRVDVAWTEIRARLAGTAHASNSSNVGAAFGTTWCVTFAHDGSPVEDASVDVVAWGSTEFFPGTTGADGCSVIPVQEDSVGAYTFNASAAYFGSAATFTADAPSALLVNFTRVLLTLGVSDLFVNVTSASTFTVCGEFEHDDAPAAGAVVDVRDAGGLSVDGATLAAGTGCGSVSHAFPAVFNSTLTAALVSTPENVTAYSPPGGAAPRMIATQAVVGAIEVGDSLVNVSDEVSVRVPLTWAHDGSAVAAGTLTLGSGNATCAVAAGVATCEVSEDHPASLQHTLSLATPEDVDRLADAPVLTPRITWTSVAGAARVSDLMVALGAPVVVTYFGNYSHDGSPVPFFNVTVSDQCGASQTVAGADGVAAATVVRTGYCATPLAVALVNATGDIGLQSPTSVEAAPRVVWTDVDLDAWSPDWFVTVGDDVVMRGNATYGLVGEPVASGSVRVRDESGAALGVFAVADGRYEATLRKTAFYSGELEVELVSDAEGVGTFNESGVTATWTRIVLGADVNDTLASVGEPVRLSGAATYEGLGTPVEDGNLTIRSPAGDAMGTARIAAGAWTADVSASSTYADKLVVSLADSAQGVAASAVDTPRVAWTALRLELTAPSDTFVNATDALRFGVRATYTTGDDVPFANLTARAPDGTSLGACAVVAGRCNLSMTTANVAGRVLAASASVEAVDGFSGVTRLDAPATTGELVWTRLVVEPTLGAAGPYSTSTGPGLRARVAYAHTRATVADALVSVANFTSGDQADFTDATGNATISAIETSAGARDLVLSAYDPAQAVGEEDVAGGAVLPLRWTAIGFAPFTYSATPVEVRNGTPVFAVGTTVTVCAVAVEADTLDAVGGARVLLRGASRTADEDGRTCLTIAKSSQPREVRFTAHALSGLVDGATISASVDRTIVLRYE